jgi:hypothetical protein
METEDKKQLSYMTKDGKEVHLKGSYGPHYVETNITQNKKDENSEASTYHSAYQYTREPDLKGYRKKYNKFMKAAPL